MIFCENCKVNRHGDFCRKCGWSPESNMDNKIARSHQACPDCGAEAPLFDQEQCRRCGYQRPHPQCQPQR